MCVCLFVCVCIFVQMIITLVKGLLLLTPLKRRFVFEEKIHLFFFAQLPCAAANLIIYFILFVNVIIIVYVARPLYLRVSLISVNFMTTLNDVLLAIFDNKLTLLIHDL